MQNFQGQHATCSSYRWLQKLSGLSL